MSIILFVIQMEQWCMGERLSRGKKYLMKGKMLLRESDHRSGSEAKYFMK